ncbi:hypothetical protein BDR26DRAFT_194682 [Obelidium mucronatum]|nr:hypothetical protein BDR26DRAFT_194682 [Obelidium mucronatum]
MIIAALIVVYLLYFSAVFASIEGCSNLLSKETLKTVDGVQVGCFKYTSISLYPCEYIQTSGYYAVMQPNSNFVIYKGAPGDSSSPVWTTGLVGKPSGRYTFSVSDKAITVYDVVSTVTHWGMYIGPFSFLCLHPSGYLRAYDSNLKLMWNNPSTRQCLVSGESLYTNQYLQAGPYHAIMQADSNLVIYKGIPGDRREQIWSSGVHGKSNGNYSFALLPSKFVAGIFDSDSIPIAAVGFENTSDMLCIGSDGYLSAYNTQSRTLFWSNPKTIGLTQAGCGLKGEQSD